MLTIGKDIKNEIIINKSKFITYVYKVDSVDMVNKYIELLKKEYKDATHYCYAYIIDNIKRFNDDKEPSHTAGMPILNVLELKNLNKVLVVVIRYFGGIKLGAGGLIRAYSNSATEAINKTNLIPITKSYLATIEFNYENLSNINYILKDYDIISKDFKTTILYKFTYNENNYPKEVDNYIIEKK